MPTLLPGGRQVTLATARALVRIHILVPAHPLANASNLTTVWASRVQGSVDLEYGGGAVSIIEQPPYKGDSATAFASFVNEGIAKAAVETVQGQPALVIWPNTDPYGSNPAFVEWVSGSTDVQISSDTYSVDQLLAIAGSMR